MYVAPYVSAGIGKTNLLNEDETAFDYSEDKKFTGGIDLKYSLTSNLTMDLTVNLTRFALFFPEKRMFFQERSSIFNFNLGGSSNLFYSRRIGIDSDGYPVILISKRTLGHLWS